MTPGNWWKQAACQAAEPDLFFPVSSHGRSQADTVRARAVCASCPVRPQCLDFALGTRQADGIWGGLTSEERAGLLRQPRQEPGAA